jgi:hypothetical protein
MCMASDRGSVKLKICHSQSVGKTWWVGKSFTNATYADRPKRVGKAFTDQLKVDKYAFSDPLKVSKK